MSWIILIGDIVVTGFMILLVASLMVSFPKDSFDEISKIPLKDD